MVCGCLHRTASLLWKKSLPLVLCTIRKRSTKDLNKNMSRILIAKIDRFGWVILQRYMESKYSVGNVVCIWRINCNHSCFKAASSQAYIARSLFYYAPSCFEKVWQNRCLLISTETSIILDIQNTSFGPCPDTHLLERVALVHPLVYLLLKATAVSSEI